MADAKKIILIEDEVFIRDLYKTVLEAKGYLVDIAEDGGVALTKLTDPVNTYDLILLDILLPIMDGISILRKIREEGSIRKNTPVFLLTNVGMETMIEEAVALGAEKYFIKADYVPKQIAEEVDKYFANTP